MLALNPRGCSQPRQVSTGPLSLQLILRFLLSWTQYCHPQHAQSLHLYATSFFSNPRCMCLAGWQRSHVGDLRKWDSGLFRMPYVWGSSATKTPNVGNCTSLEKEFHEDLVSLSFIFPIIIFISIPIHAFWENHSHLLPYHCPNSP